MRYYNSKKKITQPKTLFHDVCSKYLTDLVFIRNEIHVCYGINMFNILMISSLWNNTNSNSTS